MCSSRPGSGTVHDMKDFAGAMPARDRLSKEDIESIEFAVRHERELRAPDVAAVVTHRLFDCMLDQNTRENHRWLDRGIAPTDWVGWNRYAPPLGEGCRCTLIGITHARARKMIESGEGFDLTQRVPEGAGPDEGWTRSEGWWDSL